MFDSVIAQGSVLGLTLALCAALLRVVQSQYERMLTRLETENAAEKKRADDAAKTAEAATKAAEDAGKAIRELVAYQREEAERRRDRETQIDTKIGALSGLLDRLLQKQGAQDDAIGEIRAALRATSSRGD